MYLGLDQKPDAKAAFQKAITLTNSQSEKLLLLEKIGLCEE